jgi:hypothetical protein
LEAVAQRLAVALAITAQTRYSTRLPQSEAAVAEDMHKITQRLVARVVGPVGTLALSTVLLELLGRHVKDMEAVAVAPAEPPVLVAVVVRVKLEKQAFSIIWVMPNTEKEAKVGME